MKQYGHQNIVQGLYIVCLGRYIYCKSVATTVIHNHSTTHKIIGNDSMYQWEIFSSRTISQNPTKKLSVTPQNIGVIIFQNVIVKSHESPFVLRYHSRVHVWKFSDDKKIMLSYIY